MDCLAQGRFYQPHEFKTLNQKSRAHARLFSNKFALADVQAVTDDSRSNEHQQFCLIVAALAIFE